MDVHIRNIFLKNGLIHCCCVTSREDVLLKAKAGFACAAAAVVWAHARTETLCLLPWGRELTSRDTAGCAGPDFLPFDSDTMQATKNLTTSMASIVYASELQKWSLCLARATSRYGNVSENGAIIAPPPKTDFAPTKLLQD